MPALNILLLLRASVSAYTMKVSHSMISYDCLFSMTLLPGISPQNQVHMFKRFCTLPGSRSGTGLGLAVSKRLIENMARLLFRTSPPR
jgi:K+-sensing histidine kinase KdpD